MGHSCTKHVPKRYVTAGRHKGVCSIVAWFLAALAAKGDFAAILAKRKIHKLFLRGASKLIDVSQFLSGMSLP